MAILVFEHGPHSGVKRLGRVLRQYGHKFRIVRLHAGEPLPADLDDVHGIIATGGDYSANDDDIEWLSGEMQLLRQAHEIEMPLLGICLGCQLLARALGGEVGTLEGGIELGWHPIHLTPVGREDPLHTGIAWDCEMFHWHREQVTKLPTDAKLLASSARCNVQAWTLGVRTYAMQYHPEIEPGCFTDWIAIDPRALEEAGQSREALQAQTDEHFEAYHRLTQRMFESIALFLMPVDRRYSGVVKELHH